MKNSYKLIKKFVEYCPICDREHEIEERERISQLEIKGEIVQYKENYFVCTETEENENEFVNAKMMDMNFCLMMKYIYQFISMHLKLQKEKL